MAKLVFSLALRAYVYLAVVTMIAPSNCLYFYFYIILIRSGLGVNYAA
jgi:hypothetical protein